MPKHIRNRFIILAALILAGLAFSAPSFVSVLPSWWQKVLPTSGMRLGLDLQGGMYLILKVDIPKAVEHHLVMALSDLRDTLHRDHIASSSPEKAGAGLMRLRVRNSDIPAVKRILQDDFPDLDLASQGDDFVELKLKQSEIRNIHNNTVDQSLEILRNRVDQFGVQEPVIVRQGSDEIVLQLAGITDPQRALAIVGRTAQLEFKLVVQNQPPNLAQKLDEAIEAGRLKPNFSHEELDEALKSIIPDGAELYIEKRVDRQTGRVRTFPVLLKKTTLMTGDALKTARVEIGGRYGQPSVGLTLNARGARLFERITRDNVGRQLAIILDNIVQSAPVIEEPISGGNAQINGNFSTAEAHDLAIVLRAGALPAPVKVIQNMTVGPSLGRDSIHKGLASTILGAVLVLIFMVFYYRLSGLIANFALLLNLLLMLAALSMFHATLTLPGIAGIVLSIGMAVDSNVLIFERMREEFALSKPVYSSVQGGYDKALWTIIDAHVTTLITALALFLFGTGPIKGFAVTLSIGVLFNLFTALFGTRVVYDYLHFKHRLKKFNFLHILSRPNINFIGLRKAAFIFSGALVLLGLFSVLQIERGKANLGVELGGGTMIQFKAQKDFSLAHVRAALSKAHLSDYELQEVPNQNELIVRVKKSEQTVGKVAGQVSGILNRLPDNHFTVQSEAEIGSAVSADLKRAALIAIVISFAGIIIYLAWRFDRRFGVAAAIATFHDVLTVLGIFYLLHKEITLLVVTALLTLAGYSLTDTVVVFDRIRENLRLARRQPLAETINQSINQVLSRTVVTSGTVMLVLVALLLMGGLILHDFALALLIGVVVGTYSSVFVASPIIYIWDNWRKRARMSKSADRSKGSKK